MAELNVEPKKSSPWVWIIIAIIIILVILFFVFRNNGSKTDNVNNGRDTTSTIVAPQNQRYIGNSGQTQLVAINNAAEGSQENRQS